MQSPSLHRRLLLSILALTAAVWLSVSGLLYWYTARQIDDIFDSTLLAAAESLRGLVAHEVLEFGVFPIPVGQIPDSIELGEQQIAFAILHADGKTIFRSRLAGGLNPPSLAPGYANAQVDGRDWRVFLLPSNGDTRFFILVGQPSQLREQRLTQVMTDMGPVLLIGLLLLGSAVWLVLERGFGPLKRLAALVAARNPYHLQPLRAGQLPQEISPLVDNLNKLLERLAQVLSKERRFTADAAHELRTPLAALRTQIQVAIRADADEPRRKALAQALLGIDDATRRVTQLLQLTRMEHQPSEQTQAVDMKALCEGLIAELVPVAFDCNVSIALQADDDCPKVRGNEELYRVLVRNLLENAVLYTRADSEVEVALRCKGPLLRLSVRDHGPGIPDAEKRQVFERFYRGRDVTASGSGLGLSIVKLIIEQYDIGLRLLDADGGGLLVEVDLPWTEAGEPQSETPQPSS